MENVNPLYEDTEMTPEELQIDFWDNMGEVFGYSPPFPCLTVVGRERGAGTSSTQIVVQRESKVKPTIEAFKMSPKWGEPHGRLVTKKGR
jgi:hypothetical protein